MVKLLVMLLGAVLALGGAQFMPQSFNLAAAAIVIGGLVFAGALAALLFGLRGSQEDPTS